MTLEGGDPVVGAASAAASRSPVSVDARQVVTEELTGVFARGPQDGDVSGTRLGSWPGQALAYAVTVFALVSLTFYLPRAMPGDPLAALIDPAAPAYLQDTSLREELAAYYGLDQPLAVQYRQYLAGLARGDLGVSIRYRQPVAELVRGRMPWTLLLIGTAMALAVTIGVVAGVQAGWRRGSGADRVLLLAFLTFRSLPVFFIGSLAVFFFAARLGWFPLGGVATAFAAPGPVERALDIAHHLALPVLVLTSQFGAGYYLLMRAGMVSELGADYLTMGRAKGVRERRLKYRYAARNALLPVVTHTTMQFGLAVTGAIFIETIFVYQGIGRLVFDAVEFRDYPTLQACFLVLSLMVVTVNFATDLLYRWVDPRTAE